MEGNLAAGSSNRATGPEQGVDQAGPITMKHYEIAEVLSSIDQTIDRLYNRLMGIIPNHKPSETLDTNPSRVDEQSSILNQATAHHLDRLDAIKQRLEALIKEVEL